MNIEILDNIQDRIDAEVFGVTTSTASTRTAGPSSELTINKLIKESLKNETIIIRKESIGMNVCCYEHEEIAYNSKNCPMCHMITENREKGKNDLFKVVRRLVHWCGRNSVPGSHKDLPAKLTLQKKDRLDTCLF